MEGASRDAARGAVLVVDDDRSLCEMVEADLRLRGFTPSTYTDANEALEALRGAEVDVDVVLTDVRMPAMSGLELCQRAQELRPELPVIVMTAFGSIETAVGALRAGAYDFVTKPLSMDLLSIALERAVRHRRLQREVRLLSEQVQRERGSSELIGESAAMRELRDQVARISDSDVSVLLTGESGTGKGLVARLIHEGSRRAAGPFVPVNCGALPEALLESELFGHAKGAFTDAKGERAGLFQRADGGTIFLDEIAEIPLPMQVKLLRALEEREVRPVGSDRAVTVDVRVLAATNRDLEEAVEKGSFREDLFYRIHVLRLEVPPLRSRGSDPLLLARHFLRIYAEREGKAVTGISEPAAAKILAYPWPGNVRELRNCIERGVALTRHTELTVADLPAKVDAHRSNRVELSADDPAELQPLETVERRYIEHVLEACGDNKAMAARILGLDRKTLYRKLERYEREDAG